VSLPQSQKECTTSIYSRWSCTFNTYAIYAITNFGTNIDQEY
jgi:hypothetical protein